MNKYKRESTKIFYKTCSCGKKHELLESYAYYFKEYQKESGAIMVCPSCKSEIKI